MTLTSTPVPLPLPLCPYSLSPYPLPGAGRHQSGYQRGWANRDGRLGGG